MNSLRANHSRVSPDTSSTNNLINNVQHGSLVLHCIGRGKTVPHPSPFVLKLETYLRMADIPYHIDIKKPYGPQGKMPWITFNGDVLADSELIIEYLNKKYAKDLWENINTETRSVARLNRLMLEDHFYWALISWRFIDGIDSLNEILPISKFKLTLGKSILPKKIKKVLAVQGLGRLPNEALVKMGCDDLRTISRILGKNKFFLGNVPTQIDAAIFGILAQVVWASPGSPYEALVYNELLNIKYYCVRMKDLYWSDWDSLLVKD